VSAQLDRHRGRNSDAAEQFRRASRLSIEADWLTSRVWILAQLAGTLAEAGRLTEASRTLSEAHVLQNQASLCPMDVDGADLESAVVLAQTDQRDRAAILARKVAQRCAAAGRLAQAISALHLAARVGHARFVVDRCAQLASSVSSAVLHARADHVIALANDDADALVEIGDRFAQFGMRSLAAEAAAQSCTAYHKTRRLHSARIAAVRCHRLLTSYNIRLPTWVKFGTAPVHGSSLGLTVREHEIAGYAAIGLSNREIADRLTVSVRTVENHLQRTYNKLGISARSDLILKLDPRVSSSPGTINGATQR
jgi:ATP/maltotriose-dependent transcriptional regulator MalT